MKIDPRIQGDLAGQSPIMQFIAAAFCALLVKVGGQPLLDEVIESYQPKGVGMDETVKLRDELPGRPLRQYSGLTAAEMMRRGDNPERVAVACAMFAARGVAVDVGNMTEAEAAELQQAFAARALTIPTSMETLGSGQGGGGTDTATEVAKAAGTLAPGTERSPGEPVVGEGAPEGETAPEDAGNGTGGVLPGELGEAAETGGPATPANEAPAPESRVQPLAALKAAESGNASTTATTARAAEVKFAGKPLTELAGMTDEQLLRVEGIGRNTIKAIRTKAAEHGLPGPA
jgi:hypothetical protein